MVKNGRAGFVSTLRSNAWQRQTIRIFPGCFKIHTSVPNSRTQIILQGKTKVLAAPE